MPQSRHTVLMNAFRPAQSVDEPRFFAGRAKQVTELTDALHVVGSTPLIYGDRGLGKTSLAFQLRHIAEGSVELLDALGIRDRAFSESERFVAFYVPCMDSTRNFDGLLQQLINAAEETDFTPTEPGYRAKHLAERTSGFTWTFKIFTKTQTKKFVPVMDRPSYRELSATEKLQYLIGLIVEQFRRPVLFIIDEVDRLQDTQGLASFIKATSSERAKFVLVGIASSIGNLLDDHESLGRNLWPVRVPLMDERELRQIIKNAVNYLDGHDIHIRFSRIAITHVVGSAAGYPWLVHVIGQSALLKADEAGRGEVAGGEVLDAIYELPKNRFAQQFSDSYSRIVRDSAQRETVLRAFAEWFGDDIPTGEIYQVLRSRLGVAHPSTYKAQLTKDEFGRVIHTPLGRHKNEVRFTDPIFKIYIRLTPSSYDGVDRRVRAAFNTL
jgi:Cdc6-like AAA superfamily ATPase